MTGIDINQILVKKIFTATNVRVSDLIYIESMKEYDNKEIL